MENLGRLKCDIIKWKKEEILMPGVKFGVKYKSVRRHRQDVSKLKENYVASDSLSSSQNVLNLRT